jgi:hypothetical protein
MTSDFGVLLAELIISSNFKILILLITKSDNCNNLRERHVHELMMIHLEKI